MILHHVPITKFTKKYLYHLWTQSSKRVYKVISVFYTMQSTWPENATKWNLLNRME